MSTFYGSGTLLSDISAVSGIFFSETKKGLNRLEILNDIS